MKRKFILAMVAALLITGIAGLLKLNGASKVTPIDHKETVGNLAYEIKLSKNQFTLEDEIEVNAKVTNLGNEPIPYVSGSSSCPTHVAIEMVQQKSDARLAIKPQDCTADTNTSILTPGQTVENRWTFIPKQWINDALEPANAGTYDVMASLPTENSALTGKQVERRVSAKTHIIVRGS